MKRVFVTGTDTGVGKTRVAAALLAAWHRQGRRVAALKPVETGCPAPDQPQDAIRLREATGRGADLPLDLVCPYRYPAPASPETAAMLSGAPPPDPTVVADALARLARDADVVLLEGAGGLLVPLGPHLLTADLIAALAVPLLVVARTALGTLNHTLLTVSAARARGLPIAGIVLNETALPTGPEEPHVARLIEQHAGVRVLGTLPFEREPTLHRLAEIAAERIDLQTLWETL